MYAVVHECIYFKYIICGICVETFSSYTSIYEFVPISNSFHIFVHFCPPHVHVAKKSMCVNELHSHVVKRFYSEIIDVYNELYL